MASPRQESVPAGSAAAAIVRRLPRARAFPTRPQMVQRLQLRCHPDTPCLSIDEIDVEVSRSGGRLALRFLVRGDIGAILLPARSSRPGRTDGLWAHSCFEAFARDEASSVYHELNLAFSGDWACYRFADYREGMQADLDVASPRIEVEAGDDQAVLTATVELDGAGLAEDGLWRVGLSAVVEERNGTISYWAINHPPGKPDFHHQDCFALDLPSARSS
jgi:hypothetical protein